jgi:biotin-(acetyl-CoA carboxylase) ligase
MFIFLTNLIKMFFCPPKHDGCVIRALPPTSSLETTQEQIFNKLFHRISYQLSKYYNRFNTKMVFEILNSYNMQRLI